MVGNNGHMTEVMWREQYGGGCGMDNVYFIGD